MVSSQSWLGLGMMYVCGTVIGLMVGMTSTLDHALEEYDVHLLKLLAQLHVCGLVLHNRIYVSCIVCIMYRTLSYHLGFAYESDFGGGAAARIL